MNIKDFEKLKLMEENRILSDRVRHIEMSPIAVDIYLEVETDVLYQLNKTEKEYRKALPPAGSPYQEWKAMGRLTKTASLYPTKNLAATGNIAVQLDGDNTELLENTPRGEEVEFEVYLDSGHSFYPTGVNVKQNYQEMTLDTISILDVVADVPREDIYPYFLKVKLKGIVGS
jgi:hypothetical protein